MAVLQIQCDESSQEDGQDWREKDYGASQTSVHPDNHVQDKVLKKPERHTKYFESSQNWFEKRMQLCSDHHISDPQDG